MDPRVSIDKTHHKLVKYSPRSSISLNSKKIRTSRRYLFARRRTSVGLSKKYDKEESFEWFGEYAKYKDIIKMQISTNDRILVLGIEN